MKKTIANAVIFVRTRPLTTVTIVAIIAAGVYSESQKRTDGSVVIDLPSVEIN